MKTMNKDILVKRALEKIEKARKKFEKQFATELFFTGYENIDIDQGFDGVVGQEFTFSPKDKLCNSIEFGGWLEIFYDNGKPYNIRLSAIITFPNGKKIGGGFDNIYDIFCWDYDMEKEEWSNMYIDSI